MFIDLNNKLKERYREQYKRNNLKRYVMFICVVFIHTTCTYIKEYNLFIKHYFN